MGRRFLWVLVLSALLACVTTHTRDAQALQTAPYDLNPILDLIPALKTAPPPAWLRQGLQLTYYSAVASVLGGRHRYVPDPDNPNCRFRDEQGNCYRRQEVGGGGGSGAGSGSGYVQVSIVALDRSVAAMEVRMYALLTPNSTPFTSSFGGAVGLPGAGGDLWLNPEVLRAAVGRSLPGLRILRMPYVLNRIQYDTVRIQSEGSAWVYDAQSGILILSTNSAKGPPIQGPMLPTDSREGMTLLTETIFMQARSPNIPWALDPAPEWIRRYSYFRYSGHGALLVPGSPPLNAQATTTLQRQYVGNNWVRYVQTQAQGPQNSQNIRVLGSGQFGGLWVSPGALSQLRQGQNLDVDPITRVAVFVSQTGRTAQGRDFVTISEVNDAYRIDYAYDRASGILSSINQTNNVMRTQLQIVLTHMQ
jgi:hypothetical protein